MNLNPDAASSGSSGLSVKDSLQMLNEAEEDICRALQLTSSTCEELEKLPFSDPQKIQELSNELFRALQSVRNSIVSCVDSIRPVEEQTSEVQSTADTQILLEMLKNLE